MDKSFDLISAACTLQRLAGRMEQLADLVGNDEGAKDKVAILTRIRAVEILEELRSKIDILGKSK